MTILRRSILYFFGAFFIAFGITGLFDPGLIASKMHMLPTTIAGTGEVRGLYGGGFSGFGLVILAGLRSPAGKGLLLAMSIIMSGVIIGRLFSMGLDHEFAFAMPAAIAEFLVASLCYLEYRSQTTLS